jgi:hypothetical protein
MEVPPMGSKVQSLAGHLGTLPDPRKTRGLRHNLVDLLVMTVLAVMCGADSWEDMCRFARDQEEWLRTFLLLPGGVPSADTFNRVFVLLDNKAFGECFLASVRDVRSSIKV